MVAAEDPQSARSQALAFISQNQIHKRFKLPATADHGELSVTYADVGVTPGTDASDVDTPTLLYIPGQFSTRYVSIYFHHIAAKIGVRVLVIDRPGMGDSTPVPIEQRVSVWIETVRALTSHLSIKHIALASHSAGTIYLFNTLFHCREVLHPQRPYAAAVAPWIDPLHSRLPVMQLAQLLPKQAFSYWDKTSRFFVLNSAPMVVSSGAFLHKARKLLPGSNNEPPFADRNRRKIEEEYGLAADVHAEIEKCSLPKIFGEPVVGVNSETLICLKKCSPEAWGKCWDYSKFVNEFAERERQRSLERGEEQSQLGTSSESKGKLKIQAYFAESDLMIGKKGQTYFEECWDGKDKEFQELWDFDTATVKDTNHESILSAVDVLEGIFQEVKASFQQG
ncbi:hypothetical protein AJ80_01492 [Polytolypa hystricis UAMH7299]|uniref:AB hydrolase-1 domain-containing protein n=1 Tax=Polytolypa hystricis (strain UAMH7299) TaxID=1447883 RepID=A0A2B7Z0Z7_POLH7|nr:hypothetical protein AJ80_01492 [Polytolypa hystricis UAMH7299]